MAVKSFRDVVDLWGSPALADELGVSSEMTRKWRERDAIPAAWWLPLLKTPKAASSGLDAGLFVKLARLRFEARE